MGNEDAATTRFEKWRNGLKGVASDPKWGEHDCQIRSAVGEFNRHLASSTGYRQLDWHLIKAILWVETGGASDKWSSNPMQIGVPGDPGIYALLSKDEGGDMILPSSWQGRITVGTARSRPAHGIRAGTAYLLMRAAIFKHQSVAESGSKTYEIGVIPGDSLDRIAKVNGTTVEILRSMNSGVSTLKPGQVLRYRKGAIQRVITGWRSLDTHQVARLYNGGGDPRYAQKLSHALQLVKQTQEVICE